MREKEGQRWEGLSVLAHGDESSLTVCAGTAPASEGSQLFEANGAAPPALRAARESREEERQPEREWDGNSYSTPLNTITTQHRRPTDERHSLLFASSLVQQINWVGFIR